MLDHSSNVQGPLNHSMHSTYTPPNQPTLPSPHTTVVTLTPPPVVTLLPSPHTSGHTHFSHPPTPVVTLTSPIFLLFCGGESDDVALGDAHGLLKV